ncbi:MAG: hypothetical protein JNN29_11865 [Chitinophagaceae bacterium]|nr:hypothetical protein [Chitinophagaceae bacterium]MBN8668371.1 hypothetical protein [Chitinophagales bacterium]
MKKTLALLLFMVAIGNLAQAQFQRVSKTPTKATSQPIKQVKNPAATPKVIGTVIKPAGNFTNPTHVYTQPDGGRLYTTIRQNPQNVTNNFGGVIKETVSGRTEQNQGMDNCVSEVKNINAQSLTFMNVNYNQQAIHIFPGAIYSFTNFFSGNFRPLEQGRNAITIATDNLANSTGSTFEEVTNPTMNNINSKIATLIRPFSTTTGSANIQYRVFTSDNDADLSIKLSAGGGYAGFKASGGFNISQTEKKYYLTIDAIKPLYTLTTSVPASGFFSDKTIEANNPNLMVIKSVTYGARVLANLEITVVTNKDDVDFKASFGADSGKGVSANAFATFNYLKSSKAASTTANVYIIGGPMNTTILSTDKLQTEITDLLSRCNYQSAQPISYSFMDLNGNILGIETATDKFTVRKCVPKSSTYRLSTATITLYTGKDNKEQGSNAIAELVNSKNLMVAENNFNNIEFKSSNDIAMHVRSGVNPDDLLMESFSSSGGYVDVFFDPKPIFLDFDAWNITGAVITLNFMDQNNSIVQKQIQFNNLAVLMQKNQQRLRLPFNGLFQPGGAFMPN